MKRIKFALVAVALMVASLASAQVSLGIKGGLNMSNFGGSDAKNGYKMKLGYNVGIAADFESANGFAVQSGLFFTTKGANLKGTNNASVDLMYLQVPVHFAYKVPVTFDTRIVFHAGPYVAYGLAGNIKSGSEKIDIFKDRTVTLPLLGEIGTKGANRFDAGLGLGVGAEFGNFLVDLGWDMGLIKLQEKLNQKNQNAYLTVGYKF